MYVKVTISESCDLFSETQTQYIINGHAGCSPCEFILGLPRNLLFCSNRRQLVPDPAKSVKHCVQCLLGQLYVHTLSWWYTSGL